MSISCYLGSLTPILTLAISPNKFWRNRRMGTKYKNSNLLAAHLCPWWHILYPSIVRYNSNFLTLPWVLGLLEQTIRSSFSM